MPLVFVEHTREGNMMSDDAEMTRALQRAEEMMLAQVVRPGEYWPIEQAHVLLAGVDTLHFSLDVEVSEEMWDMLCGEQEHAREIEVERKAEYAPEWLGAVMATTGAKGGYRFRIEHGDFTVKLLRGVPNRPAVYVEMRSLGLHTHAGGVMGACEAVCQYLREVLFWDQDDVMCRVNLDEAKCSRLDLHCDWQGGWSPTLREAENRQFIKPGRVKWDPRLEGNRCTGYEFGKGKVHARIYNKTLRAREQHDTWYFTLLESKWGCVYDPTVNVWRLEFQLARDGVRGFRLYTKPEVTDPDDVVRAEIEAEDLPHVGSVRKALHWAGELWRYLTRRWLRLVEPCEEDQNRARWKTHATWEALQGGFVEAMQGAPKALGARQATLVRKERHSGKERFLHRIEVGVMASMDALAVGTVEVTHAWMAHIAHCLEVARTADEQIAQSYGVTVEQAQDFVAKMGIRGTGDQLEMQRHLTAELLGLFTSAGAARPEMPQVVTCGELIAYLEDDFERIAASKGGIGQILLDKRTKLFKLSPRRFARQWQAE
jgi:hypothetical protein